MKKSSVKKYAKTKHKGLPTKKVNEDRDFTQSIKNFNHHQRLRSTELS